MSLSGPVLDIKSLFNSIYTISDTLYIKSLAGIITSFLWSGKTGLKRLLQDSFGPNKSPLTSIFVFFTPPPNPSTPPPHQSHGTEEYSIPMKRIPLTALLDYYDTLCRTDVTEDELKGCAMMVSTMLHTAKRYEGFSYIDREGNVCGLSHPDFCEYRRVYYG